MSVGWLFFLWPVLELSPALSVGVMVLEVEEKTTIHCVA